MKKSLIAILLFLPVFFSCQELDPAQKLPCPKVAVDFNRIVWEAVPGAVSYMVSVGGKEYTAEDGLWFDLMQHLGEGTYSAAVKACGDGINCIDSDWSNTVGLSVNSYVPAYQLPSTYSALSEHPRLFMKSGEGRNISDRFKITGNNYLKKAYDYIRTQSDDILSEPVLTRSWTGSMLYVAREAIRRIFYLSYMYRMTDDVKYANKAREEMLSLCSFDDWNPSHYLDVGEASFAIAIGYDWIYDILSASDRSTIWAAVRDKSFANAYATTFQSSNNWNPVCNGGTILAALSLYEHDPVLCKGIIDAAGRNLSSGLTCYAPYGAYPEGYTYWGYGTAYYLLVMEAFESALGVDLGLDKTTGFMKSARYRQFMSTPTYGCFAYSDSGTEAELCSSQAWFAAKTGDPTYIWESKRMIDADKFVFSAGEDRFFPMLLVRASGFQFDGYVIPSTRTFFASGVQPVYVYREGWNNVNHAYLGVKGGCPTVSHAQMDAGMFYYENRGVRWCCDCGTQSYGSVQSMLDDKSQDGQCWKLFRYGPQGHNILQFGSGNQKVNSGSNIVSLFDSADKKGCVVDLDDIYSLQAASVKRSVWLDGQNNLNVIDEISKVRENCELRWNMITESEAKILNSSEIELKSGNHSAVLKINAAGAEAYAITATTGQNYDPANPGKMRVGYKIPVESGRDYSIEVKLTLNK